MKRWLVCSMILTLAACGGDSRQIEAESAETARDEADETSTANPDDTTVTPDDPDDPEPEELPTEEPETPTEEPEPHDPEPTPEAPSFGEWYRGWGGEGAEWGRTLGSDREGNVYVAGTFDDELTIGTETVIATPDEFDTKPDIFVVSFGPEGEFRWLRSYGSEDSEIPYSLLVDAAGAVYVVGSNMAEMVIDSTVVPYRGSSDIHIVSYASDGTFRWAESFGGPYGDAPRAAAINDAGQIVITGYYQGLFSAGAETLSSSDTWSAMEVFTLRYDTNTRRVDWAIPFRGFLIDIGTAVDISESGEVVVGVSLQYDLRIDDDTLFDSASDFFNAGIVKLDDSGAVLWGVEVTGEGSEEVIDLAVGDDGSIFATGVFEGTAYLGPEEMINAHRGHDVWVGKLQAEGEVDWLHTFGEDGFDQPLGLAAGEQGVYVTGRFDGEIDFGGHLLTAAGEDYDIFVTSFGLADGKVRWARSFGGDGPDQPGGISLDHGRGIYVAGYTSGPFMFNDDLQPAPGTSIDAFVLRVEEY